MSPTLLSTLLNFVALATSSSVAVFPSVSDIVYVLPYPLPATFSPVIGCLPTLEDNVVFVSVILALLSVIVQFPPLSCLFSGSSGLATFKLFTIWLLPLIDKPSPTLTFN